MGTSRLVMLTSINKLNIMKKRNVNVYIKGGIIMKLEADSAGVSVPVSTWFWAAGREIGRASCRERV